MALQILPIQKDCNARILSLAAGKKALLVSTDACTHMADGMEYMDMNAFNVRSWRRSLRLKNYDTVIFKVNVVTDGFVHAFHTHRHSDMHAFLGRAADGARLHYAEEPRHRIICVDEEDPVCDGFCAERLPGASFYDSFCAAYIRRYIASNPHRQTAIIAKGQALCADSGQRTGNSTAFVLDLDAPLDGAKFDELYFFARVDVASDFAAIGRKIELAKPHRSFLEIPAVRVGAAEFPHQSAQQVLLSVLNDTKVALEEHSLFLRSIAYSIISDTPAELVIHHPLFRITVKSDCTIKKKDRLNSCSLKLLTELFNRGFIDDTLSPLLPRLRELPAVLMLLAAAYGTDDAEQIAAVRSKFLSETAAIESTSLVERNGQIMLIRGECKSPLMQFKRQYMRDLPGAADVQESPGVLASRVQSCHVAAGGAGPRLVGSDIEQKFRKIPCNLQKTTKELVLYVFSRGSTGILCARAFSDYKSVDRHGEPISIAMKGMLPLTSEQLRLVTFYQILFFKLHLNVYGGRTKSVNYHYYAVPLDKDAEVDWAYLASLFNNFLVHNVADSAKASERLLWDPFARQFLLYVSDSDKNIEDRTVVSTAGDTWGADGQPGPLPTMLDYFEQTCKVRLLRREGPMAFRAVGLEEALSSYRKRHNLYGVESCQTAGNENKNSNGVATLSKKPDAKGCLEPAALAAEAADLHIASKEACFVTSIRKTIIQDFFEFLDNFLLFESVCSANELSSFIGIDASLGLVTQALTHSRENQYCNYERLEFLGDCVLKFVVSVYLPLMGHSLATIVSRKDALISNSNLYDRCFKTGIVRYLSARPANYRMFQAPTISGLMSFREYFNAADIFQSDNLGGYLSSVPPQDELGDKKVYADRVEAIIGCLMLEGHLDMAIRFLLRIGVITSRDPISSTPCEYNQNLKYFGPLFRHLHYPCSDNMAMDYAGVLTVKDVRQVEAIIGHRFKNPGFLEKALVHPSYRSNVFGSQHFQRLEFIGDAVLDLFIVRMLYQRPELVTPLDLHSAKMSYVNNRSLARLIICSDLLRYVKMGESFDIEAIKARDADVKKVPKAFSDIFEALLGAILCDVDWDLERFSDIVRPKMWGLIQEHQAVGL
ncbi:endoribonuclease Dicer [Pancytospora philotis]|nr:endoribonuclease Dicer [Pancytospora philotis]